MFKRSNPQQSLFDTSTGLSDAAAARLKSTWASEFRKQVLPILFEMESHFAFLYGSTGRPNFSVARMLGVCLLKELRNLSDQDALDAYSFDIRWHYALDVQTDDPYLSRRSLVEFRRRLVENDPEMELIRLVFERVGKRAIEKLGISTSQQRVDSTLVCSNIRVGSSIDLFRSCIDLLLKSLSQEQLLTVPESIRNIQEQTGKGWFSGATPSQLRQKLSELVQIAAQLLHLFETDLSVCKTEAYFLLKRAFEEHCRVIDPPKEDGNAPAKGKDEQASSKGADSERQSNQSDEAAKAKRKARKKKDKKSSNALVVRIGDEHFEVRRATGETMKSAYDPDASYGHKGDGYHVHITETCNNEGKPEIITDYEAHGAARSDLNKVQGIVARLQQSQLCPEVMYADAGYTTGETFLDLDEKNVELCAPVHRGKLSADTMSRADFTLDKEGKIVTCPQGHPAIDHRIQDPNGDGRCLHAYFAGDICRSCAKLDCCPVRAPNHRAKGCDIRETRGNFRLSLHPALCRRDEQYALQQTERWRQQYRIRSGVEGTMSEGKRSHGLGRLRVRRRPQVTFAIACKLTACNIKRWLRAVLAALLAYWRRYRLSWAYFRLIVLQGSAI